MSELDEIMEGKHEIKHLRIEGDTIAFETELDNYTWNLTSRDIEIIIYCLQNQLQQKENIIKEVREYINNHQLVFEMSSKKQIAYWFDMFYKELLDILDKENK